jgi:hypothetical protein
MTRLTPPGNQVGAMMPEPDPFAIWLGDAEPGQISVTFERPWNGNLKARKARAVAILRNLQRGNWLCRECGTPVALTKRADAVFCSEGCRKRAARWRRQWRGHR